MKTGFELFKTRSLRNELDIYSLELKYGITIPPLYRIFSETYVPNITIDEYLDPIRQNKLKVYALDFVSEKDFHFNSLGSLEKNLEYYFDGKHYWDELYEEDLLPIGACQSHEIITVGIKGDRIDNIIVSDERHVDGFRKISDNIFEFIKCLRLIELNGLYNGHKYSQLYKNWGEDFWRIRESKVES